ncbi:SDR family oxidoreductase [Dialister sp.]|uniref:SDR family oxidoreductase n=1 Tax=Dialister sp. TaxID=1955814 RepID=UPI003EFC6949
MKVWFITGTAPGGLGYYTAKAALEAGDSVAAASRHPEELSELAEQYGNRLLPVHLDVTDAGEAEERIRQTLDSFGRIDVLVNNAGYAYRAALEEGEEKQIREMYEVDLFAPLRLMRLVLPVMRKQKTGTIINITSIAAVSAAVGSSFYASAKAGLELLSDGLRKEAAPLGIRVMIVEPGALRTHFRDNLLESDERLQAYEKTAWQTRPEKVRKEAPEMGDPAKAGAVIVSMAGRDEVPLRFQVGSDSVEYVRKCYADRLIEVGRYEEESVKSDFRRSAD